MDRHVEQVRMGHAAAPVRACVQPRRSRRQEIRPPRAPERPRANQMLERARLAAEAIVLRHHRDPAGPRGGSAIARASSEIEGERLLDDDVATRRRAPPRQATGAMLAASRSGRRRTRRCGARASRSRKAGQPSVAEAQPRASAPSTSPQRRKPRARVSTTSAQLPAPEPRSHLHDRKGRLTRTARPRPRRTSRRSARGLRSTPTRPRVQPLATRARRERSGYRRHAGARRRSRTATRRAPALPRVARRARTTSSSSSISNGPRVTVSSHEASTPGDERRDLARDVVVRLARDRPPLAVEIAEGRVARVLLAAGDHGSVGRPGARAARAEARPEARVELSEPRQHRAHVRDRVDSEVGHRARARRGR